MSAASQSRPIAKADQALGRQELLTGVPEGYDAFVLGQLAADPSAKPGAPPLLVHVARDDRRLAELAAALAFFAPHVRVIQFPAWDTVP